MKYKYYLPCYLLIFVFLISSCTRTDEKLITAVNQGDLHKVQELVKQGYSIEARNPDGLTPLMISSLNGQEELTKYLVLHGAKLDAYESHGLTALHLAAQEDHSEILKLLIDSGANINAIDNARNGAGWPALFYAIQGCKLKSVEVLISKGADVNLQMEGVTPLYLAVYHKCGDVIGLLLEKGANPSFPTKIGETPIALAKNMQMQDIVIKMEKRMLRP